MKKILKRTVCLILIISLLLSLTACVSISGDMGGISFNDLTFTDTDIFYLTLDNAEKLSLGFTAEDKSVPYISVTDGIRAINRFIGYAIKKTGYYEIENSLYTVGVNELAHEVTVSRENGSSLTFNYSEETVMYHNREHFYGDIRALDEFYYYSLTDSNKGVYYIGEDESVATYVEGYDEFYSLRYEYDIHMAYHNGELYIPVATFNDLFLTGTMLVFNGKSLFFTKPALLQNPQSDEFIEFRDAYLDNGGIERTEKLAEFTYNELCLNLDLRYGPKENHGITNGFNDYIERSGLKGDLMSTDAVIFNNALARLLYYYLDDVHSTYGMAGAYAGADYDGDSDILKGRRNSTLDYHNAHMDLAVEAYYAGLIDENLNVLKPYVEIGDTAYITLDSFSSPLTDYYVTGYAGASGVNSTVGLAAYAQAEITRAGSPVRNVVIDLTRNTGGTISDAVYFTAWINGQCDIHMINMRNGAFTQRTYVADTDFNHIHNEKDSIIESGYYNIYIVVSEVSFSCANIFPAILKNTDNVTVLGHSTGGGSSSVSNCVTADGTVFGVSSILEFVTYRNGNVIHNGAGVEPDIYIQDISDTFDREWMTEYIHSIK